MTGSVCGRARQVEARCGPTGLSCGVAPCERRGRGADRVARLALRAKRGDRVAFERLWRGHAVLMRAILSSIAPAAHADDLLQDVALAAWRSIGALRDPQRFRPWLCEISRNVGRRARLRSTQCRDVPLEEVAERLTGAPHASLGAEAGEVLDAIAALPECHRETLRLRLFLTMSGAEIARRTGMTTGSVRVNLCRGMRLLRERLGAQSTC
ncbi:MAG: sigma-70 family RNA polymerase sigma factor [Planctomycetes bacterium]|nr:sigma-70 family RNA polymerase sigma factor [Planctomycetota bacterium]